MTFMLFLAFSLLLQGAFGASAGEIVCEELPVGMCTFSIASSGKRCLLESTYDSSTDGHVEFQCKTSEVVVKNMAEWIESDECTVACGVDRRSVGISSDSLLEPHFTAKLCSPACYQNCPNIVDLFYNLAIGEGVFLPDLCKTQRTMPRRAMSQLRSSGAAFGPTSAAAAGPIMSAADAPASSDLSESSVACAPTSVRDTFQH